MNKYIISTLLVLALFGCQQEAQNKTLTVGTNAEFAPFSFIDEGKIQGFEIDISEEICTRLGFEMQLKDLPFDGLIPELQLNKVDFVAAGMSMTPEREKVVDFTTPYLEGSPLCMVYSKKVDDLANVKIVVNEGYTADYYVTDILNLTPIRLGNPTDAMLALQSGRADVFITAEDTLKPLLKDDTYSYEPIDGTQENCAIMLPKTSNLKQEINAALDEMKQDGTIEKLKKKWGLT